MLLLLLLLQQPRPRYCPCQPLGPWVCHALMHSALLSLTKFCVSLCLDKNLPSDATCCNAEKIRKQRRRQCRKMSMPNSHSCAVSVGLNKYSMLMNFRQIQSLDLRGGAGGWAAHHTKRKRNQRDLLNVLKELPEQFVDQEPESQQKAQKHDTVLDALQKTVQRAQRNPRNLLQSLTQLVSLASEGKLLVDEPAKGPVNKKTGNSPTKTGPKKQPRKAETWADKVKATPRKECQCCDPQTAANISTMDHPDTGHTGHTVATVNQARKDLKSGKTPVATNVGFLKLDKKSLESVLKISGKHGVFIEHLAQNRPGNAIAWIPEERDEDDK
eukprot:s32_g49.t1